MCENYRDISLLCSAYKILTDITRRRLEKYAPIPTRFPKGTLYARSTFCNKTNNREGRGVGNSLYQMFVDFRNAYDSINQNALYEIHKEFKIPLKIITLIKLTMGTTVNRARVAGQLTNKYWTTTGRQSGYNAV